MPRGLRPFSVFNAPPESYVRSELAPLRWAMSRCAPPAIPLIGYGWPSRSRVNAPPLWAMVTWPAPATEPPLPEAPPLPPEAPPLPPLPEAPQLPTPEGTAVSVKSWLPLPAQVHCWISAPLATLIPVTSAHLPLLCDWICSCPPPRSPSAQSWLPLPAQVQIWMRAPFSRLTFCTSRHL